MAAATIVHPTYGTFSFIVATTPEGMPPDQFSIEEEELRSPGVDGRRYRTLSVQHPLISMETVADATTHAACVRLSRLYRKAMDGVPVQLNCTIAGTAYKFLDVHIEGVSPVVRIGAASGAEATSGSQAHVLCSWSLRLMNTGLTGTP
jgi:predicted signal transduction protein with EAL and GGDEF domain